MQYMNAAQLKVWQVQQQDEAELLQGAVQSVKVVFRGDGPMGIFWVSTESTRKETDPPQVRWKKEGLPAAGKPALLTARLD